MPSLTVNPTSNATNAHRAQIVTEAVISTYILEITPTNRRRERLGATHNHAESPPPTAIARSRLAGRPPASARRSASARAGPSRGAAQPTVRSPRAASRVPIANSPIVAI